MQRYVKVVSVCVCVGVRVRVLKGSVSFQLVASSYGFGDGSFSILLGSVHRPIPVRCNWSVFARKMHSISEFAKIVLSKRVTHAGFVMVDSSWWHAPFGEYLSR